MNLNAFRCLPIVTFLVFSNSVIPSTSVPLNKVVSPPLLWGDMQSRTETSVRRYPSQQGDSNSEDPTVADIVQSLLRVIACPNCRSKIVSLRLVTLFRELIRKSQQKLGEGIRYGHSDDGDDGSVRPQGMNETSMERLPPTAPSPSQDILDQGVQPPRQDFRSFPNFPNPPHYGDGQESKTLVTSNASMSIANSNLASESREVPGESQLQESSAVKEADYSEEEEEELAINELDPARHDDILFGLRRLGGPRRQRPHPKPRPTWPGMDRGLLPPIPDFPSLPNNAPPFPPPPNIAPPRPEGIPWDM